MFDRSFNQKVPISSYRNKILKAPLYFIVATQKKVSNIESQGLTQVTSTEKKCASLNWQ